MITENGDSAALSEAHTPFPSIMAGEGRRPLVPTTELRGSREPAHHPVMVVGLGLLTGKPEQMAALQRVIEGAPTYARRITGYPPGPADAQSLMTGSPPGVGYSDKFVWGITLGDDMIGCADVIRGWPSSETAHIGLLLLTEAHQGQRLGRRAYEAIEAETRRWPRIRTLRLAVVATNAEVLPFWHRMGFAETGEVRPYRYDKLVSESIILAKHLLRGGC